MHKNHNSRPLDQLQLDSILKALKADRLSEIHTVVFMATHTGLRMSEIAALRWQEVDFNSAK